MRRISTRERAEAEERILEKSRLSDYGGPDRTNRYTVTFDGLVLAAGVSARDACLTIEAAELPVEVGSDARTLSMAEAEATSWPRPGARLVVNVEGHADQRMHVYARYPLGEGPECQQDRGLPPIFLYLVKPAHHAGTRNMVMAFRD